MNWKLAIILIALAITPVVALVFYLVLRKEPDTGGAMKPDGSDLLADCDYADYVVAAERLAPVRVEKPPEPHSDQGEIIEWQEPEKPYRPETANAAELLAKFNLRIKPAPNEHRVLIDSEVFQRVELHLKSNTSVELGGLLVGTPYYDPALDAYYILIQDSYAAVGSIETATSFEYTTETWRALTPKLQEMQSGQVVVGSYHSHPGLGVFLSTTDIDTQVAVFSQEWQVALVIDPIRSETGFFISQEGKPVPFSVV